MQTARDDEPLRTHDAARAVLTYAACGARVRIYRPPLRSLHTPNGEGTRCYELALPRLGRQPVVAVGSYALGSLTAGELAAHVRRELDARLKETP